jgi:hypothetical protein
MSARGFRVDHDGNPEAFASWQSTNFLDPNTDSFVLCGWVRLKGPCGSAGNAQGHIVFAMPFTASDFDAGSGFIMLCDTSKAAGPWQMAGSISNNATWNAGDLGLFAQDTDYFWAIVYDGVGHNAVWYWAVDGAGSLSSATYGSAIGSFGVSKFDGIWLGSDNVGAIERGANMEITDVKFWMGRTMTSGQLFSEMNSDTVVDASSIHSRWPLANSSDTSDSTGNGHTLTFSGTVTNGVMDPTDIGGGGGGGGSDVFFEGFQSIDNGFKAATAAGMQGVLITC